MHSYLLDLGAILLFGFVGAHLAYRYGQSVIIGYILVGALIGPKAFGLVQDTQLIGSLSDLGIVLLMFFLGLEFSLQRLKRVRNAVLAIGSMELLANLSVGFIAGYLLGWDLIDRAFLAGIVAMSSSGVVAKLLVELRRTASPEAEALMGIMVFEDFMAAMYLGVLSSIATTGAVKGGIVGIALMKTVIFYAAFLWLGGKLTPHVLRLARELRAEELFSLLILSLVVLAGAAAERIGLAAAAGAFLLGMVIPGRESQVGEKIHAKLEPFRDVFMAIFFLLFGMLTDLRSLPNVAYLLLLIVPLSILTELFVTSFISFIIGFPGPIAFAIGAGMIARGEYSLIYASLGQRLGAVSPELFQFTGPYVFVMTLIAPLFMKNARALQKRIGHVLPDFISFAGNLVSLTLQAVMVPQNVRSPASSERLKLIAAFIVFLILLIYAFMVVVLWKLLIVVALGLILIWHLNRLIYRALEGNKYRIDYSRLPSANVDVEGIIGYVSHAISGLLAIILLIAAFWMYGHIFTLALLLAFLLYQIGMARKIYKQCLASSNARNASHQARG